MRRVPLVGWQVAANPGAGPLFRWGSLVAVASILGIPAPEIAKANEAPPVDLSGYRPDCGVDVRLDADGLLVAWPIGDGEHVFRDRVDLEDEGAFGHRTLTLTPDLRRRKWVHLEAWDVAVNGAFALPVWLESGAGDGRR